MDNVRDSKLLERISQKDHKAFNEFWFRYDNTVLNLFQRLLRNKHLVKDAYQQLFLVIWRDSHNYRGGDVRDYISGIAANIYEGIIMKDVGASQLSSSFEEHNQGGIMPEFIVYQHENKTSPNIPSTENIIAKIHKFIDNLPEEKKEIFTLRMESDFGWSDISERVGKSEDMCRIIYGRLHVQLRATLEEYLERYATIFSAIKEKT